MSLSPYSQRVADLFEGRAARYDAAAAAYHTPLAARLLRLAKLRPGEAVLDVGAGTGLVALQAAAEVGRAGRAVAVDLSPSMLDQAAAKAQAAGLNNLECLVGDADACLFPPASFDAILCSSSLPFFPDIPASLARWHTWLRPPHGRAAFNVPKGVGSRAFTIFAELAAEEGLALTDPSSQFADEGAVRQLLADAGFSRCTLGVTHEVNRRPGLSTPEAWAAAGWKQCLSMPFVDLPGQLSAGQLAAMEARYMAAAAQLAAGWWAEDAAGGNGGGGSGGGIAEPYDMLWVVAEM